jgi:Zn-dependent protease with chaperone function
MSTQTQIRNTVSVVGERAGRALKGTHVPGLGVYAITLACQFPGAFARGLIVEVTLGLAVFLTGWSFPVELIALLVAFGPLVLSLLVVVCPWVACPVAGRWWEMNEGGRPPEQDELEAFEHAIAVLQLEDETLRPPKHWFVAEDAGLNVSVYADSLCLTRGLLESPTAAPAYISHEYEHLRSGDGRLTCALDVLALWDMEPPQMRPLRSLPFRGLLWLASGQAALWLLGNAWETYWRSREYAADEYTIGVGQGPAFARSLRSHALPYERPMRRMRFSMATHPYTKPRMTRLEGGAEPADVTPASGQLKVVSGSEG